MDWSLPRSSGARHGATSGADEYIMTSAPARLVVFVCSCHTSRERLRERISDYQAAGPTVPLP